MKTAMLFLAFVLSLAIWARFVSPYPPYLQNRDNTLRPPLFKTAGAGAVELFTTGPEGRRHLFGADSGQFFLLGTDTFGRDLFTRISYGARISLTVPILGTVLALLIGTLVGLLAAIWGGWVDAVCMELTNFVLSLPNLFVVLALRALFPWDITTIEIYLIIIAILALVGWADIARLVRAKLLVMKSEDYVQAAIAAGASPTQVARRHLLPGLAPYWLVQASFLIPAFLMIEVTLSFLGVGIQEPDPSWGNILRQGLSLTVLTESPWILLPGILIVATVLSFNALGEGLNRRLEPRNFE